MMSHNHVTTSQPAGTLPAHLKNIFIIQVTDFYWRNIINAGLSVGTEYFMSTITAVQNLSTEP